ncbi:hypothetical protein B566_EDAN009122 [Ephemera danica]|nr:hypothetical protein B566_EDAN009122 [Ephemera danica]
MNSHRTPYYYSDIKDEGGQHHRRHHRRVRQSISLDCPRGARHKHHRGPPGVPKRNSVAVDTSAWCYDADVESPVSERAPCSETRRRCSPPDGGAMPCDTLVAVNVPCSRSCHHVTEEEPSGGELVDGDMSARQRHVYETAFDSRVQRSDDDLDEVDRVSNHPVLRMFNRAARGLTPRLNRKDSSEKISKNKESHRSNKAVQEEDDVEATSSQHQQQQPMSAIPGRLVVELGAMRLSNTPPPASGSAPSPPPLRGYAPSPPSTAPLPAKFHNNVAMNSIQSAPNLPAGSPARLKDLRLPVKSLRGRADGKIREIKGRPTSVVLSGSSNTGQRPKYSSTESMATSSSSMSSLESLRSSTSEGNRSSSSSGSRRSDSLSSHSSDSGGDIRRIMPVTRCAPLGLLSNKLHILSPISDKSQEPVSETSDNNRNNNSQRASPEEAPSGGQAAASPTTVPDSELPWDAPKLRRRQLQNKNLINLQLQGSGGEAETLQGSDSGISIESQGRHLADLPFDMPKLRRRLAAAASSGGGPRDTSSSATSVASSSRPEDFLQDLPFDMPKLRRRQLRPASAFEPLSSSSSTHRDTDSNPTDSGASGLPVRPPNLALDLGGHAGPSFRPLPARPGGLSLNLGCSALTAQGDPVDQRLPLERQGWYHGAISRVEAEAELRLQKEGSYLVRNSESSRHDYSLSLKSARGFMHMRIQQDPKTGHYILGQFSKPFVSIPEMVHHYSINRLPIRGAEHMCLLHPVIEQLL